MPLCWKPTIPEDPNPEDISGSLRHYSFARVCRVQNGPSVGRFRWYLNDLPGSVGIQRQGLEDTLNRGQAAVEAEFQKWLNWVGLMVVSSEAGKTIQVDNRMIDAASDQAPTETVSIAVCSEDRLPRYLADLCTGLGRYLKQAGPDLDQAYKWEIPAVLDGIMFERGSDSLASANARLKRSLSAAWHAQPERRYEIAQWYVATWGGVRSNREATLKDYIAQSADDLANWGAAGVATYSKILAIIDPDRFPIFDARVAAALNALQIIQGHGRPIFFPKLPSRNSTVQKFQEWMDAQDHGDAHRVYPSRLYQTYLKVLTEVGQAAGLSSVDEIEMVLFAKAEDLSREAMELRSGHNP